MNQILFILKEVQIALKIGSLFKCNKAKDKMQNNILTEKSLCPYVRTVS